MGAELSLEVVKHGYYPKGGGKVIVKSKPSKKLYPIVCMDRGNIKSIHVHSVCGQLPKHVAERQGHSALRTIQYHYSKVKTSLNIKAVDSFSPGSSVTCYAVCDNSTLGGNYLGERGLKAELVGDKAAEELIRSLKSKAAFDKYMTDQILIFIALAKGKSEIKVEELTDHCRTNIHVIEQILPVLFNVNEARKEISVQGSGFEI
jgi:RNA 3'-terminal phosphate cyclase (ATP)